MATNDAASRWSPLPRDLDNMASTWDRSIAVDFIGIALVVVMLVLGVRALYARRPAAREKEHMRGLVHACYGDTDLAERLMLSELTRAPSISLAHAAQRARKRLMRDRAR